MAVIKLSGFSGEQPRIVPRLMPANGAKSAVNTRLDDGSLSPFNRPNTVFSFSPEGDPDYVTIYRDGETWMAFESVVHLARGPVATERLYYTGDGVPKLKVGADTYDLALPRPSAPLTATPAGGGSGDPETRVYVYTYVTSLGEESEPSDPSDPIDWQPSEDVTLSGFAAVPTGRAITKQRIYRSQTGTQGTDLYFIAERTAGTGDFTDDVPADAFVEPLPSRYWNPPPDDLAGLITLPNGMMAGFVGNELCFSEPYRPHAWPEIYRLSTDIPIVALAALGTSVYVLTEGQPYLAEGTTPETMQMTKLEANFPCLNGRGVVDLGFGVAYPSNDGLVIARGGAPTIISGNIFSPDDWRRLNPGTMRGGQYQGRWVGSYNAVDSDGNPTAGSLIIDVSGEAAFLIRSDVSAEAWFYDEKASDLFFLDPDGLAVKQFDPGDAPPALQYWRSKEFILARPDNFGVILIETGAGASQEEVEASEEEIAAIIAANEILIAAGSIGGDLAGAAIAAVAFAGDILEPVPLAAGSTISVGVYADRERVATIGQTNKPARLPGGFLGRIWEIDVFGDIAIDQITMARTADDLSQVA